MKQRLTSRITKKFKILKRNNRYTSRTPISHRYLAKENTMEHEQVVLKYPQRGKTYIKKIQKQPTPKTALWLIRISLEEIQPQSQTSYIRLNFRWIS